MDAIGRIADGSEKLELEFIRKVRTCVEKRLNCVQKSLKFAKNMVHNRLALKCECFGSHYYCI